MKAAIGLIVVALFLFAVFVSDTTQGMAAVLGGWMLVAAGFSLANGTNKPRRAL